MPQAPNAGAGKGFNFSSVMDMFRGGNTPPAAGGGTGAPTAGGGGGGQQQDINNPNNPLTPKGSIGEGDGQQQKQQEESPLAAFKGLWDNPEPKAGEQAPTDWNDPMSIVPAQTLDAAKVSEASKKIDFSRVINPETAKKALSGDVTAFNEVINSVMQASFTNFTMLSARLVDGSLRAMAPRLMNEALPHHMKRYGVNEGLAAENPIFSNPAVAPMLKTVKEQLQLKNPTAPASEITRLAKDYIVQFANAVNGGKGTGQVGKQGNNTPGNQETQEMDWINDFLGGGSGSQPGNSGPQL